MNCTCELYGYCAVCRERREGWCAQCAEYGHTDDDPHGIYIEEEDAA